MTLHLASLYEAVAAAVPERSALTCGDVRLTFAELDRRANAFAAHLVSVGVEPGAHVGLYLLNGVEYVEAMLGCFKVNAVPININYRYTEHELLYLFNDAQLAAVVVGREFTPHVAPLVDQCSHLAHVLVVADTSDVDVRALTWSDRVSVADYEPALAAQPDDVPPSAERSPDARFVLYTGGTTGMPKGVVWRHEDFFMACLAGGNPYGPPHTELDALATAAAEAGVLNYLITVPLMHGAASYSLFMALFSGGHVTLMRTYDPLEMLRIVQAEKIQIVTVVGDAIVRPLVDALREHKDEFDLSSLFVIGSGGAILSPTVQAELAEQLPSIMIRNSFGASESGLDGEVALGADGLMRLTPKPSVRVVDLARPGLAPAPGEIGQLARSGHVPLAYFNDPEKSARTFPVIDGVRYVVPGDLARVEEDGTIVVLGRGSGCINSGGEKIFPEEVEQALKAHPAVMDALVAGVADERFGERVGAVVELRAGASLDVEELRTHCRTMLAGYKVPATVTLVDAIVRSPTGKADYRWAKGTLADVAGAAAAGASVAVPS
ncbi:acyl-CoA synthetase [Nocardioides pacificus]